MPKIKQLALLGAFLLPFITQAQPAVKMADQLRENGKIYVVVIIVAIIFAGIVAYLIHIDRKLSKIEKEKR